MRACAIAGLSCRLALTGLAITAGGAAADPLAPTWSEAAASPGWGVSMSHSDGVVTVPSWVALAGGSDASRFGSLAEGVAANGRLAIAYGETGGLNAAAAGNTAPSINPEDRRTVNMRASGDSFAGSTVDLSTSASESREAVLDSASPSDFGAHRRSSAGAGAAVSLLDNRIHLTGEFAGARLDQPSASEDALDAVDGLGMAHRVRADVMLLQRGNASLAASAFQRRAEAGYAIAGPAAPDRAENGGGLQMGLGALSLAVDGAIGRNNLNDDPAALVQRDQTIRPSVGLSLDRLRAAVGMAFPSAVRLGHGITRAVGTPVPGGGLGEADATAATTQSDMVTFDWLWNGMTRTSLDLSLDRTDAERPGAGVADAHGQGMALRHAIGDHALATTLAMALRQSDSDDPANPGHAAFVDLSAAVASRHTPFGNMVASFTLHHAENTALNGTDLGTTWHAKAAVDLAALPTAQPGEGRVTMAVSLNGNPPPDREGQVEPVEMVVGLAAQLRF